MKKFHAIVFTSVLIISAPCLAVDTDAVIGGAVGGGLGAAVGSELGGRNGAIVGGAVGAGIGAAIATDDRGHDTNKHVIYREYQQAPPGHAYGHRIPPGHAKHKHKHKGH